jgi:hypothetical protein
MRTRGNKGKCSCLSNALYFVTFLRVFPANGVPRGMMCVYLVLKNIRTCLCKSGFLSARYNQMWHRGGMDLCRKRVEFEAGRILVAQKQEILFRGIKWNHIITPTNACAADVGHSGGAAHGERLFCVAADEGIRLLAFMDGVMKLWED